MTVDDKFDKLAGFCWRQEECEYCPLEKQRSRWGMCFEPARMTEEEINQAYELCFPEDAEHIPDGTEMGGE